MNKRKAIIFGLDILYFCAFFSAIYMLQHRVETSALHTSAGLYFLNLFCMGAALFGCRALLHIYSSVWRFAGVREYIMLVVSDMVGGIFYLFVNWALSFALGGFPMGHISALLCVALVDLCTLCSRFGYQWLRGNGKRFDKHTEDEYRKNHKINIAIVGAGHEGALLAEELNLNECAHYKPICFVDNDKNKIGQYLYGLKIYGEDAFLREMVHCLPVQEIVIALPNLSGEERKKLYDLYRATGCKVKLYDYTLSDTGAEESSRQMREFRIEDLLFRDPLNINNEDARRFYAGKVILVTGGGGSIGSELCRQLARLSPKKLIILDIYENNAYDIQQELVRKYGARLDLAVEIASVRDRERLECVFRTYRPQVVFHAAAHKHVPLMEHSCCEAVKNNVFGTYNTADMAEKYGVQKFILISTDKAVNPTNVMGASKRMCEMVVQCRTDSKTEFAAVRFGNVLGSNGSVIPLFKQQIAKGGPITLTDKRIIRYFMTIPEASQLVMQAGAMAKSGELFVLDMGKPIRILDLAENMIRLTGYKPYEDIDIVEIGLRPGEKLFEELLIKTEELDRTDNSMIFVERDKPLSRGECEEKLRILHAAVESGKNELESEAVRNAMKKVVPTYHDPEEVNCKAEKAEEMQDAKEVQALSVSV